MQTWIASESASSTTIFHCSIFTLLCTSLFFYIERSSKLPVIQLPSPWGANYEIHYPNLNFSYTLSRCIEFPAHNPHDVKIRDSARIHDLLRHHQQLWRCKVQWTLPVQSIPQIARTNPIHQCMSLCNPVCMPNTYFRTVWRSDADFLTEHDQSLSQTEREN